MPRIGLGLGLGQFSGGGGSAFIGLLDTYPNAAAAYSVRLLRTAYTGSAIRVRRSSDNAEQDIGFVSGSLDTSSLTSLDRKSTRLNSSHSSVSRMPSSA